MATAHLPTFLPHTADGLVRYVTESDTRLDLNGVDTWTLRRILDGSDKPPGRPWGMDAFPGGDDLLTLTVRWDSKPYFQYVARADLDRKAGHYRTVNASPTVYLQGRKGFAALVRAQVDAARRLSHWHQVSHCVCLKSTPWT